MRFKDQRNNHIWVISKFDKKVNITAILSRFFLIKISSLIFFKSYHVFLL